MPTRVDTFISGLKISFDNFFFGLGIGSSKDHYVLEDIYFAVPGYGFSSIFINTAIDFGLLFTSIFFVYLIKPFMLLKNIFLLNNNHVLICILILSCATNLLFTSGIITDPVTWFLFYLINLINKNSKLYDKRNYL